LDTCSTEHNHKSLLTGWPLTPDRSAAVRAYLVWVGYVHKVIKVEHRPLLRCCGSLVIGLLHVCCFCSGSSARCHITAAAEGFMLSAAAGAMATPRIMYAGTPADLGAAC
jgi:hypothetical protein